MFHLAGDGLSCRSARLAKMPVIAESLSSCPNKCVESNGIDAWRCECFRSYPQPFQPASCLEAAAMDIRGFQERFGLDDGRPIHEGIDDACSLNAYADVCHLAQVHERPSAVSYTHLRAHETG